jgi:sulfur carrier protein
MNIQVNDKSVVVDESATLEAVLDSLENIPAGCGGIAVAVNDELVHRTEWASHILNDGDHVLIIKAASGG